MGRRRGWRLLSPLFDDVVGQDRAVAELKAAVRSPVHAYLLTGPAGTGAPEAARSFAAALLCPTGGCGVCDTCRRARAGVHPDVVVHERVGASITVPEAREIARLSALSPAEAARKVMVLVDFHLVQVAAPVLLKAIEEPPATTVFVVLADDVPAELVTIASRCVRVELAPLAPATVAAALVAEGATPEVAAEVAAASGGRLDRARLLVADAGFAARLALWRSVPTRIDGTGETAAILAAELVASMETVLEPLRARHQAELAELEEQTRLHGARAGVRRQVDARQAREERRLRTDELRAGLATLAAGYRDRLVAGTGGAGALEALDAIAVAIASLVHNPNVVLLLQALLVRASRSPHARR